MRGTSLMSVRVFDQWLESTALSHLIQTTHGAIAGIQVVHILALATLFALALNLALRVTGHGLAAEPLSSLASRFVPALWICLGVLLFTGSLLIIAEPGRSLMNRVFYTKMTLLLVAIALTLWLAAVARRPLQRPSKLQVAAAALYVLVWVGIIVAGRYIAYSV